MTELNWIAANVADELVGAITSAAGYIAHKPEYGDALKAAVVDGLNERERGLLRELAENARRP